MNGSHDSWRMAGSANRDGTRDGIRDGVRDRTGERAAAAWWQARVSGPAGFVLLVLVAAATFGVLAALAGRLAPSAGV